MRRRTLDNDQMLNLQAITLLEAQGNLAPTQAQIDTVEQTLTMCKQYKENSILEICATVRGEKAVPFLDDANKEAVCLQSLEV